MDIPSLLIYRLNCSVHLVAVKLFPEHPQTCLPRNPSRVSPFSFVFFRNGECRKSKKIPLLPLPPHYINGHPRHVTLPIKRLEEPGAQKICTMTFVQTKVCKNISRVSRVRVDSQLFRFLMIAVHWAQSDGTHLYPKKYYLAKIYSSLSQLQVPLRNLELFLAQGGLTPLQVLLKRERALSWPLLQQLANAPLSLFRATHILTLPSVTATVSLYLFFTHCLKILCFIYRVFFFFSLVPP